MGIRQRQHDRFSYIRSVFLSALRTVVRCHGRSPMSNTSITFPTHFRFTTTLSVNDSIHSSIRAYAHSSFHSAFTRTFTPSQGRWLMSNTSIIFPTHFHFTSWTYDALHQRFHSLRHSMGIHPHSRVPSPKSGSLMTSISIISPTFLRGVTGLDNDD